MSEIINFIKKQKKDLVFYTFCFNCESFKLEVIEAELFNPTTYNKYYIRKFTTEEYKKIIDNIDAAADECYKNDMLIVDIRESSMGNVYLKIIHHTEKSDREITANFKYSNKYELGIIQYSNIFYDIPSDYWKLKIFSHDITQKCFIYCLKYMLLHLYEWNDCENEEKILEYVYKEYNDWFEDILEIYKEKYDSSVLDKIIKNLKFKTL